MKTYCWIVLAPIIFVLGNIIVTITIFVKFVASVIETVSHATYKWCSQWSFCTFNDIIDFIIAEYHK